MTPDAYSLPNGTIVRLGFGDRWETTDGYPLPEPPDLDGATPLWLSEAAPPDTLAAVTGIAREAIASVGTGGHSHWRQGGAGGRCMSCEAVTEEILRLNDKLAAALAAASPVPAGTDAAEPNYGGALRWLAVQEQANELQRQHPDWRRGQALFNALHGMHRDLAEQIRGSDTDPFHDASRERVQAFAGAIMAVPAVSADTTPEDPS